MKNAGGLRLVWLAMIALVALGGTAVQAQDDIFSKVPSDAVGVVVIRDGLGLDKKIERTAMQIMPMQPGNPAFQVVVQMLREIGRIDAAQLKADAPIALAVMLPPAGAEDMDEPKPLLIVQPKDFNAFVQGLEQADGIYDRQNRQELSHIIQSGDYALLGNADSLKALAAGKLGLTLNDQQKQVWQGADVLALVDIKKITAFAAPFAAAAIGQLKEGVAELEKKPAERPGEQLSLMKMQLTAAENGWALAQELNWAAMGMTLDARATWMNGTLSFVETGQIASYLGNHPPIGEKLAPNLPDVTNWVAGWYSYNPATVIKGTNELFNLADALLKQAPLDEQMRPTITKMVAEARQQLVGLMSQTGGRGAMAVLSGEGDQVRGLIQPIAVCEVKDAAAYRKQMQEFGAWYQQTLTNIMQMAGAAEMGQAIKLEMVYTPDAQKIGDLSVDKFAVKVDMNIPEAAEAMEMNRKMMKAMYGSETPTQWLAFKDGYMFSEMGPEPKLLPKMVEAVSKGEGLAAAMADARKNALADSNLMAIVSLSGYMDLITSMMMSLQGVEMPMPPAAPVAARTVISLGTTKNSLSGKFFVPVQEMQMAVASGMRMVMSMQGLGNIMPGNGGGNGAAPAQPAPNSNNEEFESF